VGDRSKGWKQIFRLEPDLALVNAGELITIAGGHRDSLGIIENGAMVVNKGLVHWVGSTKEYNARSFGKPRRLVDAGGRLVTPGFVDPHTHTLFAGSREDELERKISGESYISILNKGGGIGRTIRETRAASLATIVSQTKTRISQLMRNGVTTLEVKTGYGQDLRSELKLLEAIGELRKSVKAELIPTFLGLHAKPPEFEAPDDYVHYAIGVMLPAVAKLKLKPVFSDCFCEDGVFSEGECSRYLRASKILGFRLKVHAD